jgi:hypothetical protein
MPYVNTYIEVDDVLDELSDVELIDELKRRGTDYNTNHVDGDEMRTVLQTLYEKRRLGKDYQAELDHLIYSILGKVV